MLKALKRAALLAVSVLAISAPMGEAAHAEVAFCIATPGSDCTYTPVQSRAVLEVVTTGQATTITVTNLGTGLAGTCVAEIETTERITAGITAATFLLTLQPLCNYSLSVTSGGTAYAVVVG